MLWFISGYDLISIVALTARRALQITNLPNKDVESVTIIATKLEGEGNFGVFLQERAAVLRLDLPPRVSNIGDSR